MDARTCLPRALLLAALPLLLAASPPAPAPTQARFESSFPIVLTQPRHEDAPWFRFFPDGPKDVARALAAVPFPSAPRSFQVPRRFPGAERARWSPGEKTLAFSYVTLSALDAWQTSRMPEGYREANPVLASLAGERPELWEVIGIKALIGGGVLWASRRASPGVRRTSLALASILQLAVVVHNERATGGILTRNE